MARNKFFIFLISILIGFLIVELTFRLFYPVNLQGWYGELIDKDKKFFALKKNYFHKIDRWNYQYSPSYKTGEYRNRINRFFNIKNGNQKILILGDSFTFGLYLNDEDTYVGKLQKKFNNYYLVNSSTPGWSLEDYSIFLEKFCTLVNPKKIIIILNDGDLGRIRENAIHVDPVALKEKYIIYKFLLENSMVFNFLREKLFLLKSSLLKRSKVTPSSFEDTSIKFNLNETLDIIKDAEKIFLKLKSQSLLCEAQLNIIYLGWGKIKKAKDLAKDPTQFFIQKNKEFFFKNSINFYDNSKLLSMRVHENKKKYIIKNEGHPNEIGADELYQSLFVHFKKILD